MGSYWPGPYRPNAIGSRHQFVELWVLGHVAIPHVVDQPVADLQQTVSRRNGVNHDVAVGNDADEYPLRNDSEERSLFTLNPTKIVTFGAP